MGFLRKTRHGIPENSQSPVTMATRKISCNPSDAIQQNCVLSRVVGTPTLKHGWVLSPLTAKFDRAHYKSLDKEATHQNSFSYGIMTL